MVLVCRDCVRTSRHSRDSVAVLKQHHEILVTGLQGQIDRLTAKVVELVAQSAPDDKGGNDAE